MADMKRIERSVEALCTACLCVREYSALRATVLPPAEALAIADGDIFGYLKEVGTVSIAHAHALAGSDAYFAAPLREK